MRISCRQAIAAIREYLRNDVTYPFLVATNTSSDLREIAAAMPDSVKQTYYIPREYGFWVKDNWMSQSVGYVREDAMVADASPVVYPPLGYFTAWHIWNGKFVIVSGTPYRNAKGEFMVKDLHNDTCDIAYLDEDSLVLSDGITSRSYYKKNNINEVNKKAQEIASRLSKQVLEENN